MICMLVRDFAPTQEKRLNAHLSDAPLVLIEAGTYRPKVLAPDERARCMGVKAGMWLGEARTLSPIAEFLPVETGRYERLFADVTRFLLHVTPRIEPEYQPTSAAWYTDDVLMLPHLHKAIQTETGIAPQVGTAATKFPARVAAAIAQAGETCAVPEGGEATFLAPYPVTLLPLDKAMQRRLPLLGLHTLGQLACLPRIAIWEQFGKHGRWLHDLANGIDMRPLSPFKPPIDLREQHTFDDPIADRQIAYRVLERLSLRLIENLAGREARQLMLLVHLEDQSVLEHHRQPHEPVRDNLYLLRLLTQMLDALPVTNGIETIEVRLRAVRERLPVQLSLFEEKKPVQHIHDLVPEWAARHQRAEFYRLHPTPDILPEHRVEKRRVHGG